ncbi:hypothetical protein ACHAWF_003455, partial [Thalassiosira exigua]
MSIIAMTALNQLAPPKYDMTITSQRDAGAMDSEQTTILRFHFEQFIRKCYASAPRKILATARAKDEGGNSWQLMLRRGGVRKQGSPDQDGSGHDVMISMILLKEKCDKRMNDEATKYTFIVRDIHGNVAYRETITSSSRDESSCGSGSMKMFMMKSFEVDHRILVNGTLTIDVAIEAVPKAISEQHSSSNQLAKNMLNVLHSGKRADVVFKIGKATVLAHKFILEVNAPALARLCKGTDPKTKKAVHIYGTSAETFRHVLSYVYGGAAPDATSTLKIGRQLIVTANRFDLLALKLDVERSMVENFVVDASNCIDFILFSDKNDCSLLKEHAISHLAERPEVALATDGGQLQASPELMREITSMLAEKSKSNVVGVPVRQRTTKGRIAPKGRKAEPPRLTGRILRIPRKIARHKSNKKRQASLSASESELSWDADMIRERAKGILERVDHRAADTDRSRYLRMHGNHGWIVS